MVKSFVTGRSMVRFIFLLCGLIFMHAASSACGVNACDATIKRLYETDKSGGVVYIEVADSISSLSCTAAEDVFVSLKSNHPLFKEIYSMLLSSMIAKSKVRVRVYENTPGCELAYSWMLAS